MARYIDADVFLKKIERYSLSNGTTLGKHSGVADEIIDILTAEPTADVVPRERYNRAMNGLKAVLEERAEDKAEVAREIFEEIEKHLFVIAPIEEFDGWARIQLADIMRLKKKYTEAHHVEKN